MDHSYWRTQTTTKPLFPNIEWNKPERRDLAGKLGIIGGNKLGFIAVAESYATALTAGTGTVRALVPDSLRKTIPPVMTDVLFGASNPSGSLAQDALADMRALGDWADSVLLIGDAGRNSETALVYDAFIHDYTKQLIITRDAIDLVKNNPELLVSRPNTTLVGSFAQLQKLFQGVYYPKMLTFSMQLANLVEALHKFTITYPVTLVTLHRDTVVIAHAGEVVTQEWGNAMAIWRGTLATTITSYQLWNPSKPLEAAASALLHTIES